MTRTIACSIPASTWLRIGALCVLLVTGLLNFGVAWAQSGGAWAIVSSTVDGGGVQSATGGAFMLNGTIGQSDAGALSGGEFRLDGGFWRRGLSVLDAPPPPPRAISHFSVQPAFPNPTSGACSFSFDLPSERQVRVDVFDVNGRLIRTLLEGVRPAGRHAVHWDGAEQSGALLSQGLYFVRIRAGADQGGCRIVRMGDHGGFR